MIAMLDTLNDAVRTAIKACAYHVAQMRFYMALFDQTDVRSDDDTLMSWVYDRCVSLSEELAVDLDMVMNIVSNQAETFFNLWCQAFGVGATEQCEPISDDCVI